MAISLDPQLSTRSIYPSLKTGGKNLPPVLCQVPSRDWKIQLAIRTVKTPPPMGESFLFLFYDQMENLLNGCLSIYVYDSAYRLRRGE